MTYVALVVYLVGLVACIWSAYHFGKDAGVREAYKWRARCSDLRSENALLKQRIAGLQHEVDNFTPPLNVWNNYKVAMSDVADALDQPCD